jgi:hypothetical protein
VRMTGYAVVLPADGESAIQIMKANKVVEEWRAGDSLDEILASAERIARKEWGEDPMLYFVRFEGEETEDGDVILTSYQIYVEDRN